MSLASLLLAVLLPSATATAPQDILGDNSPHAFAANATDTMLENFSYKVIYFPVRGRAELSRVMLEYAGAKWEDEPPRDWPATKNQQPFGQLPVLVEYKDGIEYFRLAQSHAIERFVANKLGLVPKDPYKRAELEAIFESYLDLEVLWRTASRAAEVEEREKLINAFYDVHLPNFARFHEPILHRNGDNGVYLGEKLTYVELFAYLVFEKIIGDEVGMERVMTKFEGHSRKPGFVLIYEKVAKEKKLAGWLKSERRNVQKHFK
ncbi:hypothetical protein HK101_009396 [Irineochytrium annulatum]|nr:hypothetical protein HK101_009396 [Irineochytrium annulatum]